MFDLNKQQAIKGRIKDAIIMNGLIGVVHEMDAYFKKTKDDEVRIWINGLLAAVEQGPDN